MLHLAKCMTHLKLLPFLAYSKRENVKSIKMLNYYTNFFVFFELELCIFT